MGYKINIHAHTIFSDGQNTPYRMALEAKELGFTALVITDHYYASRPDEWCSLNLWKMHLLRRACKEAKQVLPVIVGIELAFGGEEILTFGSAVTQAIMEHVESGKELTMEYLLELKQKFDCAFVLCHPGKENNWKKLSPLLDGYERFNSGSDMFKHDRRLGPLESFPGWCNSDAHSVDGMARAYNVVDAKIETETDLIRYIKRGAQPVPYLHSKEDA